MRKKRLQEKDAALIKVGDQVVMNGRDVGELGDIGLVEGIEYSKSRALEFIVRLPDDDEGPYRAAVTIADIESIMPAPAPAPSALKPKR